MHVKTLILGGGLTGLSTAYHLEQLGRTVRQPNRQRFYV